MGFWESIWAFLKDLPWEYLIAILVATVLGFAIGFERKIRFKEAGVRTHAVVSAGACLIMLVSKYGFEGADSARVAAQIVSGIGFIGAGMILYKQQALQGLTTAAGIWTTAGVGMAVGAGMYFLAVGATAIIIIVQCIMHLPYKVFRTKHFFQMKIVFTCANDENEKVKEIFHIERFQKVNITRGENDIIKYTAFITTDKVFLDNDINKIMRENPFVISVERVDET